MVTSSTNKVALIDEATVTVDVRLVDGTMEMYRENLKHLARADGLDECNRQTLEDYKVPEDDAFQAHLMSIRQEFGLEPNRKGTKLFKSTN